MTPEAAPRDVLAHILWKGMRLALIGVAPGISLSLIAVRLPARCAARLDQAIALRDE